ncbi:MAG: hypothetical protein ACJ79A_13205 [Gemmatimonadaceae bacterium]
MRTSPTATLLASLIMLVVGPAAARAQHEGHATMPTDSTLGARSNRWHLMAQAIPIVTHAANTAEGADLTEAYLSQSVAMGRGDLLAGHLRLETTLNAEGMTMERGELSTGAFGEGYVDRRHPHTYVHEIVASGLGVIGPLSYSLSAGRGFAAFGTDDPMMRPFEKYPINHHLAQILERPMVTGAIRLGAAIVEASTFGGDEPTSPGSPPLMRRFGDSWSVRATALPLPGIELQGSYARVASPEQREGFGLDQRKRSISARLISANGGRYLLAEWARTVERDHGRNEDVFAYESALVEGAMTFRGVSLALRAEQTDRPEEERTRDPFRVPRPAPDLGISGITRWRTATASLMLPSPIRGLVRGYPFVEAELTRPRASNALSVFDAESFYRTRSPWMLTAGLRLRLGSPHARMGRYGVAIPDGSAIRALGILDDTPSSHHHH